MKKSMVIIIACSFLFAMPCFGWDDDDYRYQKRGGSLKSPHENGCDNSDYDCRRGLNLPPVTGWGTDSWPSTMHKVMQFKHQKERDKAARERQMILDKQRLEQLKFDRQMKAIEQIAKLLEMAEKYPSQANVFLKSAQKISDEANLGFDLAK